MGWADGHLECNLVLCILLQIVQSSTCDLGLGFASCHFTKCLFADMGGRVLGWEVGRDC